MEYTIDATGKSLGRLATEAVVILRGKNNPSFAPHLTPTNKLTVTNASKIKVTGNKLADKLYRRHSGQPGGEKYETLTELITKKGYDEAIRRAVDRMLPTNRLHKIMMSNLKIQD